MNDPAQDVKFLARAGVELEPSLLPLLSRIGVEGPMGTVELAGLVGRDHSTVSRQLTKLEKAGLVRRMPTDDGRLRLLEPTSQGRAMLAKLAKARRTLIETQFEGWTDEEKQMLLSLLQRALKPRGMFS
jgi:DNA-binding MarR family transcriptional regulator